MCQPDLYSVTLHYSINIKTCPIQYQMVRLCTVCVALLESQKPVWYRVLCQMNNILKLVHSGHRMAKLNNLFKLLLSDAEWWKTKLLFNFKHIFHKNLFKLPAKYVIYINAKDFVSDLYNSYSRFIAKIILSSMPVHMWTPAIR